MGVHSGRLFYFGNRRSTIALLSGQVTGILLFHVGA